MEALLEPVFLFKLNPFFTSKNPCSVHCPNLPKLPSKPLLVATCCAATPSPSPLLPQDSDKNSLQLSPDRTRDRRKVVRIAWEKLVRWSRSWRSKAKTDVLERTKKVVVLGGGSFGTAMAAHVANRKAQIEVSMLVRDPAVCRSINENHCNHKYFPDHKLPENVTATSDAKTALLGADYCLHAVPVQYSTSFLEGIAEHVDPGLPFISLSKGLELNTLRMMSQIIPQALKNPCQPFIALSGPSFALELMNKLPTAMVVASKDKKLAGAVQQLLSCSHLRISTSRDVTGVEIAGALKNVLAIAAGIVEGMNLGNNSMAALVAQGCSEIRWLATKMGAKPATITGLSGTGDIMLTCFVNLSRNKTVGVRLGSGEKLEDILSSMNQVAEGVSTAGAVIALAQKYNVKMPVLTAVARIMDSELTPNKAVLELMSLPQVVLGSLIGDCTRIVNAETGLGKTIAYLAPIIHQLQGLYTRIERSHGTFALVLVPTHELCMQLYAILQQLSSSFIGVVPGYVMDGENRTKARGRLRKGISILIATPGRLLDHLKNTSFVYTNLRWIVFDEADRILELGFGKDIEEILDLLGSRAGKSVGMANPSESQRQNLLLLATLNEQVNHLAKISLENPVMIGLDKVKMQPGSSVYRSGSLGSNLDENLDHSNKLVSYSTGDGKLAAQSVEDGCGTLGDLMCGFNARMEAGKRPAGESSPSPSPAKKVKAGGSKGEPAFGAVDDEKIAKGIKISLGHSTESKDDGAEEAIGYEWVVKHWPISEVEALRKTNSIDMLKSGVGLLAQVMSANFAAIVSMEEELFRAGETKKEMEVVRLRKEKEELQTKLVAEQET
ncbi:hypothetical protein V6N11_007212 [Hibiscus sabdariffa]|uniref:Glycerol-3-phosphate dehydrogenase [NAD(+)] n=1 Tax=Hibiscus sabdariffa TaxID=183260 RepID=A0ABR2RTU7_9ROSI